MRSVVFCKDEGAYRTLSRLILEICPAMQILPSCTEEEYRLREREGCELEVVALDGALGMETVTEHRRRFPHTRIIWVTNDPYFAGVALRQHVFEFLIHPISAVRFQQAILKAVFPDGKPEKLPE